MRDQICNNENISQIVNDEDRGTFQRFMEEECIADPDDLDHLMVTTRSAEKSSGAELSAGAWWRDTLKVGITALKSCQDHKKWQ